MIRQWTRRTVAVAMVTALAIGLAGCGGSTGKTEENKTTPAAAETKKEPIKLGAVFITTGPSAGYGISQTAGLKVALDEINAAGGINGHPLVVQFEDTGGDKDKAINAVQKLIDKDNVLAIIGPTLSAEMFAAGPVANQKGVPILGISNTAKGITDIGDYVFRNSLPEAGVLPTVVKMAKEKLKVQNAALLFDNQDDFSKSGADVFNAAMEKEGIKIVDIETFATNDNNFSAQIDKALAAKPDGIFISSLYPAGSQLLLQLRAKGYKGPVFGGNGFNSPKVFEIANNAAENLIVGAAWNASAATPLNRKFVEAYNSRFGALPDQFAAQAYDGLKLVAKAIEKANTTSDRDKVRAALASITDYVGATGKFAFDSHRDPVQTPFVLQIQGGKYVELK